RNRVLRFQYRKTQDKFAALTTPLAARWGSRAMLFAERARKPESDAQSSRAGALRIVSTYEHIEHPGQHLGSDTHSVIPYGDLHFTAPALRRQVDTAAAPGVLGGIVEQIREYLSDPHGIRVEHHRPLRQRRIEVVAGGSDSGAAGLHGTHDDTGEIDGALAQLDAALGNARQLQQVVDQAHEAVYLAREYAARLRDQLRVAIRHPQQLDRIADWRERIAQLVRQRGEELVLAAVRIAQNIGFLPLLLERVTANLS